MYCQQWLQLRLGCVQHSPSCPFRRLHISSAFFGHRGIALAFGYGAPHLSARGTSTLLDHSLLSTRFVFSAWLASGWGCRGRRLPKNEEILVGSLRFSGVARATVGASDLETASEAIGWFSTIPASGNEQTFGLHKITAGSSFGTVGPGILDQSARDQLSARP